MEEKCTEKIEPVDVYKKEREFLLEYSAACDTSKIDEMKWTTAEVLDVMHSYKKT